MADKVEQLKLILLGDEKVGKSSFFNKYVNNNFIEEYNPSLKTQFKKISVNINGESINIQIWDTPGNEQKHKIYSSIYLKSSCIIVLFNITNKDSFENIFKKWIPNFFNFLKIKKSDNFPMVILGNFNDLDDKIKIPKQDIKNRLNEIVNYTNYFLYQEFSVKNESSMANFINKVILFIKNKPKEIMTTDNKEIDELKEKVKVLETERNTLNEKVKMLEEIKKILTEKQNKDKEEKNQLNEAIKKLKLENEEKVKNKKVDTDEKNILNDKINALELQKELMMKDINIKIENEKKNKKEVEILQQKINELNENIKEKEKEMKNIIETKNNEKDIENKERNELIFKVKI